MKIIKKLLHNKLGWGYPIGPRFFDGVNTKTKCQFCDQELCQDSTGAWFHLEKPKEQLYAE